MMRNNDGGSQHQQIQFITEGSELYTMQNDRSLVIGSVNDDGDEDTTSSSGCNELMLVPEQSHGELISSTLTSLGDPLFHTDGETYGTQHLVDERQPVSEDPTVDELESFDAIQTQICERSDERFEGTTDSTFKNNDEEISSNASSGLEQITDRTEESAVEDTTPIIPPPSFGLVHGSSVSAYNSRDDLPNADGDINAHCYFVADGESVDEKQSSLPSLQWFPLTSSTQSDVGIHGTIPPISGNSSGDAALSSENRGNPLYPVVATPIHEPTTISARLVHDHYPKLYNRCARSCGTKRKRRLILALFCFLLVAAILSLALGLYFGMKRCSHVCYEQVSLSIHSGWSPSLCPLATCYSSSRVRFMSYWQAWCTFNYSDVKKCSDVVVVV